MYVYIRGMEIHQIMESLKIVVGSSGVDYFNLKTVDPLDPSKITDRILPEGITIECDSGKYRLTGSSLTPYQ